MVAVLCLSLTLNRKREDTMKKIILVSVAAIALVAFAGNVAETTNLKIIYAHDELLCPKCGDSMYMREHDAVCLTCKKEEWTTGLLIYLSSLTPEKPEPRPEERRASSGQWNTPPGTFSRDTPPGTYANTGAPRSRRSEKETFSSAYPTSHIEREQMKYNILHLGGTWGLTPSEYREIRQEALDDERTAAIIYHNGE